MRAGDGIHKDWMGRMTTTHVSDDSFDNDVIKAANPVLVDFWA